ncbi:MAG: gluconolaconase [Acidobacteriota bacterium]
MRIQSVTPAIALPGGIIRVELEGLKHPIGVEVDVGGVQAELVAASTEVLTVRIPPGAGEGIRVVGEVGEATADLKVGRLIASEFHAVANPVVDSFGNVYVTLSGARGEKVPFGVYVVHPDGTRQPFLADITNPTAMAIGPDHCLYVTSRHTGVAYRSTFDKQVEKYVDGLGLATGVVFDSRGNLLVGDRGGRIFKVKPTREVSVVCELEPSVSAYHLAIGEGDVLYVTGPTLSTQDSIYRVSPEGEVEVFFKGLGRPQGLAFDRTGDLQVVASYRGKKGVCTFRNGKPEWTISGPMLVGLAYNEDKSLLYLVDNTNLYGVKW